MKNNKTTLLLSILATYSILPITHAEEIAKDSATNDDAVLYLNNMTVTQSASDATTSPSFNIRKR